MYFAGENKMYCMDTNYGVQFAKEVWHNTDTNIYSRI